ncbi:hypothetical protein IKQ26_07845 [bacterium]|nr:hypothetical protein [bacterium]
MSTVAFANPKTALYDRTKGNFQNRVQCSAEHMNNHSKTAIGTAAGVGAAAFLGDCLIKSGMKDLAKPDYLNLFKTSKGFDKVTNGAKFVYSKAQDSVINLLQKPAVSKKLGKSDKFINKYTKLAKTKLGKLTKTKGGKTGLAVALIGGALVVLGNIANHFYKAGQIDQKYTDKAKMAKAVNIQKY